MLVLCLGIHCCFVSTLSMWSCKSTNCAFSNTCWNSGPCFGLPVALFSSDYHSCRFYILPLHFKPSENDVTLCIVPFLASIKNWASTKVLAVSFFWVYFWQFGSTKKLGFGRLFMWNVATSEFGFPRLGRVYSHKVIQKGYSGVCMFWVCIFVFPHCYLYSFFQIFARMTVFAYGLLWLLLDSSCAP